jgi:serine/threonine-protein kinase
MGRTIDHRADIYALGVILYQIFAGRLPFDGATAHEIVLKHVTEAPVPPSRHRPIEPAPMEGIILDCLAKEPDQRPANVRELGARIDAAFAAEGGTAARPGATTIPRLPSAALSTPGPGRTEILPESSHVPGLTAAQPASPTTLRGATGERAVTDHDLGATGLAAGGGRGWRRPMIGVAAVALVAIAVGFGVRGRHTSDAPVSAAAPASATAPAAATAPPRPILQPPPVEKPALAPVPADGPLAPQKAPAVAATSETSRRAPSHKHESKRPLASATTQPSPEHPAATKPVDKADCNPNYYFDAQARKHFKPECF